MDADEALTALVAEHGDRLLRLAYQLARDSSTAEDIVQEALVSIYRTWRRMPSDVDNPFGYARQAVVREFLRRRRLRSASEVVTDVPPELASPAPGAEQVVDRDEVWRLLALLPARQRAVLVLRFYEDLPDDRIAALIDARPATVRSLALRGLTALRSAAVPAAGGAS